MSNLIESLIIYYPNLSGNNLNSLFTHSSSINLILSIQVVGINRRLTGKYSLDKEISLKKAVNQLFKIKFYHRSTRIKIWRLITPYGRFIWQSSIDSPNKPEFKGFYPTPELVFIKLEFEKALNNIKNEIINLHKRTLQLTEIFREEIINYMVKNGVVDSNFEEFIRDKRESIIHIVSEDKKRTKEHVKRISTRLITRTSFRIKYPYNMINESKFLDFELALELFIKSKTKSFEEIEELADIATAVYSIIINPSELKIDVDLIR